MNSVKQQENTDTVSSDSAADTPATTLLTAARTIYDSYCNAHGEPLRPLGVAIDRQTHRGHLIFTGRPILLPREAFIPLNDLDQLEKLDELESEEASSIQTN